MGTHGKAPAARTFAYTRETVGNGSLSAPSGKTYPANSGGLGSGLVGGAQSVRNYGQTPVGTYTATNCRETGGLKRCDLAPSKGTNVEGRTALQIHGKSLHPVKSALNADSRGCIATPGVKEVRNGDTIVVKK